MTRKFALGMLLLLVATAAAAWVIPWPDPQPPIGERSITITSTGVTYKVNPGATSTFCTVTGDGDAVTSGQCYHNTTLLVSVDAGGCHVVAPDATCSVK